MRARAILFYCCIAPLRMLMYSKELRQEGGNHEPVYLYDFAKLLNALEWILALSVDNPATVLPVDFTFFFCGTVSLSHKLLCRQKY